MEWGLSWFRKTFIKRKIRSALSERIISPIKILRKSLKRLVRIPRFILGPELIPISYCFTRTPVSYLLGSFLVSAIQADLRGFIQAPAGFAEPAQEICEPPPEELVRRGEKVGLILARVSTDRQAEEGHSIDAQISKLTEIANQMGIALPYEPIVEAGVSATTISREKLNMILEWAAEGRFNFLLATGLDRIGRTMIDSLHYVEQLRELGVKIVAVGGETDITTVEGLINATIQFLSAELENRRRAESAIAGRLQSFQKRKWNRPIPLGYRGHSSDWIEKEGRF